MSSLKDSKNTSQNQTANGSTEGGEVLIDKTGVLTRLNYFDGKFLRAADLQLEQAAMLNQMRLTNQATGGGLIHGFDCSLSGGDSVIVSSGLGYDWQGRALLLSQDVQLSLADLLSLSAEPVRQTSERPLRKTEFADCEVRESSLDPGNVLLGEQYYLLVISHVEAYCGEEDVYGKLCSEACISDTQRTHIVEGIRITAEPLILSESLKQSTALTMSKKHLRSRVASAFFEQERSAIETLITQQGLSANTWCLGAEGLTGQGIPIAMFSRKGATTGFLDAWAVRRERIDTPPELYWAARMGMRAKQVFWAQLLQFQCQLRDCLGNYDPDEPALTSDPCAEEKALIQSAAGDMKQLLRFYADVSTRLTSVSSIPVAKIATLDVSALQASIGRLEAAGSARISQQLLIDCGIVELPSAGYLPVAGDTDVSINQQVRQLLGAGVDLRFCSVRPDYVHHAIEQSQHLERICLLKGLDDVKQLEEVDILVPDGVINQRQQQSQSPGYQAHLDSSDTMMGMMLYILAKTVGRVAQARTASNKMLKNSIEHGARVEFQSIRNTSAKSEFGGTMSGAARVENHQQGIGFYLATENNFAINFADTSVGGSINFWGQMTSSKPVFSLASGERSNLASRFVITAGVDGPVPVEGRIENALVELNLSGQLIAEQIVNRGSTTRLDGRFIGDIGFRYRTIDNGEVDNNLDTSPVNDTLTVTKAVTPHGEDVVIRIPSPALFGDKDIYELVYEQKQSATGATVVKAYLATRTDNGIDQRVILSGHFVPDDDVLNAGNSFYSRSMVAINNIASSLDNAGFADLSSNLLFPPAKPVPDELSVNGPHSWVVFHRRRDRVCGNTQAPTVVAKARSYRVFQVQVSEKTTQERLLALLENSFATQVAEAKEVELVEFAGNSQNMSSPHQRLRESWRQKVGEQADVLVSVIASQGEALSEGSALASSRLLSTNSVLDEVADIDDSVSLLIRETVPGNLNVEVDGAIVYFTRKRAVNADCHAVYQVLSRDPEDAGRQIQDAIVKYNSGSTETTFDWLFNNDMARKLSVAPHFLETAADYLGPEEAEKLKEVWQAAGGEYVTHSAVLYPQENDTVAASAIQQRDKILETIGILEPEPGENRAAFPVPEGMLDACKRATVLLVASQCHQVYLVAHAGRDELLIPNAQVGEAEAVLLEQIFTEFDNGYDRGLAKFYSLGELVHYWDNKQPLKDSAQAFAQNWNSALQNNPQLAAAMGRVRTLTVYSAVQLTTDNNGNVEANPNAEQARQQASNLAALMSLPPTTGFVARETDSRQFPSQCPVATFVVVDTLTTNAAVGELIRAVRFTQNHELMRGPQFEKAMKAMSDSGENVTEVELAYDNDGDKPAAQARAKALKAALVEQGLAARNAKVTVIKRDRNASVARKQVNLVLRK